MADETQDTGDLCGLCGEPGADKFTHPHYWPTEERPEGNLVHAKCEREECERAYLEFLEQVGHEGVREFLRP